MTQQLSRVERIEDKIDRGTAGAIAVTTLNGGALFKSMSEVMEFSKLMSVSDVAIPKHLRGNPGACMAICLQAIEWRMSPYAVANKSYLVNDRIGFESQLIHAVIEMRAPIEGRLRHRYTGEGQSRRCIVSAKVKGEAEPFEFTSSTFGEIQPKNSPLWKTKPDLQLFYNASRDWARVYFPDVILGVYSDDELRDAVPMAPAGKTPVPMPRAQANPPAVTSVVVAPSATTDPYGNPVRTAPRPASEEEAERIIQEAAARSRQNDEPTDTAEERHEEENVPGSPASTEPAADEQQQQQTAAGDDETTPTTLPDPCPVSWVVTQLMKQRPEGMSEKEAEQQIGTHFRIRLPRPWDKMTASGKQHHWDEWQEKGFPWKPAASA